MSNSKIKTLSDRMKEYEEVSNTKLVKRTPVIIRIDGKAFHTFTRGLDKPFDDLLSFAMEATCRGLVENVQGCKLAYTQSDEISLLLTDWEKITTDSFFDYRVQKMVSVIASMSTLFFNKYISDFINGLEDIPELEDDFFILCQRWGKKINKAMFDARAFNLPKEEVCNYFIWRQKDASRNSIQSLGRSMFSSKQMLGKSNDEVQDMLFTQCNINWNDLDTKWKRGFAVYRTEDCIKTDYEIPLFNQDRQFIESFLEVSDEKDI